MKHLGRFIPDKLNDGDELVLSQGESGSFKIILPPCGRATNTIKLAEAASRT